VKRFPYLLLMIGTVALLSLSACSGAAPSLDGSSWNLSSYQNEAGEMVNVLPGSTSTALSQANHVT